jgi:hypothetical protein
MSNNVTFNTAGSIALAVDWVIQGPYSYKFLTREANTTVRVNAEFFARVNYSIVVVDTDTDLTEAHLDAGSNFSASTTYYIYVCLPLDGTLVPVFRISENATYPAGGWDADTSRNIGGFDTDGDGYVSASTLWDLRTAEIDTFDIDTLDLDSCDTDELAIKTDQAAEWTVKTTSELVTISAGQGASGVNTSGDLAPVGLILGCAFRVTQAPGGGAAALDIGITGGDSAGLIDGASCDVLGETGDMYSNGQMAYPPINKTATTLTLTTDANVTVSAMIVRVTVWYADITAPSS